MIAAATPAGLPAIAELSLEPAEAVDAARPNDGTDFAQLLADAATATTATHTIPHAAPHISPHTPHAPALTGSHEKNHSLRRDSRRTTDRADAVSFKHETLTDAHAAKPQTNAAPLPRKPLREDERREREQYATPSSMDGALVPAPMLSPPLNPPTQPMPASSTLHSSSASSDVSAPIAATATTDFRRLATHPQGTMARYAAVESRRDSLSAAPASITSIARPPTLTTDEMPTMALADNASGTRPSFPIANRAIAAPTDGEVPRGRDAMAPTGTVVPAALTDSLPPAEPAEPMAAIRFAPIAPTKPNAAPARPAGPPVATASPDAAAMPPQYPPAIVPPTHLPMPPIGQPRPVSHVAPFVTPASSPDEPAALDTDTPSATIPMPLPTVRYTPAVPAAHAAPIDAAERPVRRESMSAIGEARPAVDAVRIPTDRTVPRIDGPILGAAATPTISFAPSASPSAPLATAVPTAPEPAPIVWHLATPMDDPQWRQDFSDIAVRLCAGRSGHASTNGETHAHITLNPAGLGPVEVAITLNNGAVDVSFAAATSDARQAIEQSLPLLSEKLHAQGLHTGQFDVSHRGQDRPSHHAYAPLPPSRTAVTARDDENPASANASPLVGHRPAGRIDLFA